MEAANEFDEGQVVSSPGDTMTTVTVMYEQEPITDEEKEILGTNKDFITCNRINLAKFEQCGRKAYSNEVKKLMAKDEQTGKQGVRLLDDALIAYIEKNESQFKSISLPRAD